MSYCPVVALFGLLSGAGATFAQQSTERPTPAAEQQEPVQQPLTPAQLYEKVSPSVVKVIAKDEDGQVIGTGSGFAISARVGVKVSTARWIVTNEHVIRGAPEARIDPPSNSSKESPFPIWDWVSEVAFEDPRADLAVLSAYGGKDDPAVNLGDDSKLPIGTRVFVVGSPQGLKNTLSEGLVSGYRDQDNGDQWMQITAPISSGSSGGPVFTPDGSVVGIVVASHDQGQDINFAVPVSSLRRLLAGPAINRPLWKGTSIVEEARDTHSSAFLRLYQEWGETFATRLWEMAEKGDQTALVVAANIQYENGLAAFHQRTDKSPLPDGQPFCEAIPLLRRAIKEKATDYDYLAYYSLGNFLGNDWLCLKCTFMGNAATATGDEMRRSCFEPAIPLFKKSTELNPKFSPAFAGLARAYLETEQYPEALVASEFLVTLAPQCWEAYLLRGTAFGKLGRTNAADKDFGTAARLRPNSFDVYRRIAEACPVAMDRKAIEVSLQALSLALPEDEEKRKERQGTRTVLWYNVGIVYERLGELGNACHAYEESRKLGSWIPDVEERIVRCKAGLPPRQP